MLWRRREGCGAGARRLSNATAMSSGSPGTVEPGREHMCVSHAGRAAFTSATQAARVRPNPAPGERLFYPEPFD